MVQPIPKHLSRERKEDIVENLKERIEEKPVVGVLDMHNLPSKQLQQIKKEMKEFADVTMARKTLMRIAIENADREGIEKLEENGAEQPAFIFSEKDPFQLFSLIQNNQTSAAAQGGEEAPDDIEVDEGDTGIGPGPMLGELQGAGLNVQVDDGSIHVQEPGVIIKRGDTITRDDADLLNQLGIEPLQIGLTLDIAFAEGELFTPEELDIDTEQYRSDVESAASTAFRVAVNAGVVNETTAKAIVSKAAQDAKNLSISEGIPTEETIEEILAHASSNAEGVDSQFDLEDVEIEDEEEETESSEESSDTPSSEQEETEETEEQEETEETEEPEEGSEDDSEDEPEDEKTEEEESENDSNKESNEDSSKVDYDEIVSGTIDEAKEAINDLEEPDYEALLDAEESNKDRTTLVDWLENQG